MKSDHMEYCQIGTSLVNFYYHTPLFSTSSRTISWYMVPVEHHY